jgi:carbonic anhydrase
MSNENMMQTLVEGVHYFQNIGFKQQQELFERLAKGQNPEACFITCSDSRIDPTLITHSKPGQLFIIRNAGNIIPCHDSTDISGLAAIEFAAIGLGIKDFIICGHTQCGAMKSLLNRESLTEMPAMAQWLNHAEATTAIIKERYSDLNGDALVTATAEENVLVQLEHLRSLPVLKDMISEGTINLHGWMYNVETGKIFAYDSEKKQFDQIKK